MGGKKKQLKKENKRLRRQVTRQEELLRAILDEVSALRAAVQQLQRRPVPAAPPVGKPPSSNNKRKAARSSPSHPKIYVHARYRRHELTFHQELWAEMGLSPTAADDWTVRWNMRMAPELWQGFKPWQKTNYVPGILQLIRKDRLHECISAMQRKHGAHAFDFWPHSFHLPRDRAQFEAHYSTLPAGTPWILKPPSASCGRRIRLISSLDDMPDRAWMEKNRPVAQQYLDTLLLDGYKFTFRLYVVVTSVDPLRVYLYEDGLARIASKKYQRGAYSDPYVHLDSVDVNEANEEEFRRNPPRGLETQGLRATVRETLRYLAERDGCDPERVWDSMRDVVVKSVLSGEHAMVSQVRRLVRFRESAFDLLGFDVLLDADYKPWVLEINHSPSMAPITPLENAIKKDMLRGYFSLADLALTDRQRVLDSVRLLRQHLDSLRAPSDTPYALADWAEMHRQQDLQITRLSERDLHALAASHFELLRRGNFQRVFPCPDMHERYGSYYAKNRNVLLQLWHDRLLEPEFEPFYQKAAAK